MLLHHMGKDDMPDAAGPSQLGAICRPGQAENTACVGLLQRIGPLEGGGKGKERIVNGYSYLSAILNKYLGGWYRNEKQWEFSRVLYE